MCVSKSRTVTRSLPYFPNSGMKAATGSVRRIRPSSINAITAGVVATTFGERREVEDRVERHRLHGRLQRTVPVGAPEHDRIPAAYDNNDAWRLFGGDRVVDDGIEPVEPREIEPGGARAGRRG